jgi:hypothetical protein
MANGDRPDVLERIHLTAQELVGFKEWLRAQEKYESEATGGPMDADRVITNGGMSANPEFLNECRKEETEQASSRQVGGSHYKNYAIEPSYYILKNNIGWLEGNAIKYLTRWKDKGGRQDLEKAKHYVELLLEWTK